MSGGRLLLAAVLAAGAPAALLAAGAAVPAALAPGVVTWDWSDWGWMVFGLAAQGLFAGRFLVQWLATERAQRVVVPVAFWWLSLAGGLGMLVYFVHRREPVGLAGQLLPLAIYARNLVIHRRQTTPADDSARRAAGGSEADGA